MSFLSVFVLRRREPDARRPYRAWGYPWTTGLVLAGSMAFLAGQLIGDTRNTLWSLALIGLSYPVYRFIRRGRTAIPTA
jgi:basic amino acid/polyamine antiporter, APA family